MKNRHVLGALLFALGGLSVASVASATPGIAIDSARLPPLARAELKASIDKARVSDASTFRDVRDVVAHAREADRRARGRKAPVALHLAGMGTKALLPMLELVAFDAPPLAAGETAAERASVQRDLIEAIGLLHDVRATPVLVAILAREGDFEATRTAAEAVARLETADAATALLAALGKASGERANAILAGMGACHRKVIADTLAMRLSARPDETTARHVVKALGKVGNAWAWPTLADRSDEAQVREAASRALVAAYVHYTVDVREAAAKALLVVDDTHTEALVEAARRGASADLALALDELARRLAANPTHTR
jgi:hypothetical protein